MEQNKSFAICIPTLNRIDLLLPALMYYAVSMPKIKAFIYDNGSQNIEARLNGIRNVRGNRNLLSAFENYFVFGGIEKNTGVATSWNFLINAALKEHTHALVLNDDVIFDKPAKLVTSFINNPEYEDCFFTCMPEFDWSVFLLPKVVFNRVGGFDEDLNIYYNDDDYRYRLFLGKEQGGPVPFLNPAIFKRSSTLEKEPLLETQINNNKNKYIEKWGGLPGKEIFKTPYGK